MDLTDAVIPNSNYRMFILQLSRHFTTQDMEELMYVLEIPSGIAEGLTTNLQVFKYLERIGLVGPNDLHQLERLFILMKRYDLHRRMLRTFNETLRESDFSTFANIVL